MSIRFPRSAADRIYFRNRSHHRKLSRGSLREYGTARVVLRTFSPTVCLRRGEGIADLQGGRGSGREEKRGEQRQHVQGPGVTGDSTLGGARCFGFVLSRLRRGSSASLDVGVDVGRGIEGGARGDGGRGDDVGRGATSHVDPPSTSSPQPSSLPRPTSIPTSRGFHVLLPAPSLRPDRPPPRFAQTIRTPPRQSP